VLATLEKQQWMIRAQTPGSERAGADPVGIRADRRDSSNAPTRRT
jgi:hypothetical protein